MSSSYQSVYQSWQSDPQKFWAKAAADVQWYQPWTSVLDATRPPFYRWFDGGELNTCHNALDYHVENDRAEQVALIYDSPVTDTIRQYSYRELRDEVARLAGALASHGVGKGVAFTGTDPILIRRRGSAADMRFRRPRWLWVSGAGSRGTLLAHSRTKNLRNRQ